MEIFTQEKLSLAKFESSVGELKKASPDEAKTNTYLDYPGVSELLNQTQKILNSGQRIKFKTKKVFQDDFNLDNEYFLNDNPKQNLDPLAGLMVPHFGSLLNTIYTGQKVLGSFSLAYIEAKTSKEYHECFFGKETPIDHFYTAKGICNLNTFEDTIKAFDIAKNELAVLLLPENSVKAFRRGPFSGWQIPETKSVDSKFGKLYHLNNRDQSKVGEIKLVDQKVTNLDSPLYKVKIDERWILVVVYSSNYQDLQKPISLEISKDRIESIKANTKHETNENETNIEELNCSLGQAARVIFELFGGDYESIPEIMLNFEGGSWSSIAMESSSSGRHNGTNSLHEVIKQEWYKHPDLAVPWNYIAFDRLTEANKHLLENENIFLVSLEQELEGQVKEIKFIECPQNWKKLQQDLVQYVIKFIYKEYANLGSKRFLLSTKELMSIAASFLVNLSANDFDSSKASYQEGLSKLEIQDDLVCLLELIANAHLLASTKADFFSSKTHPENIARIQYLVKAYRQLEILCPISSRNFYNKVCEILGKDTLTESTTLLILFKNQLQ